MERKKTMKLPNENTLNLLFEYEVGGGQRYYEKVGLDKFTWPGGQSGPTIGIGIDCAYYSKSELADIFKFLNEDQIRLIQGAIGQTGDKGKEYTKTLRRAGITIPWERAVDLFEELTWPKYARATEFIYPESINLCDDAYGALVSLVFNRGTSLKGPSRKEMLAIKSLVAKQDYNGIAKQLRLMKRLWQGSSVEGLVKRREAEAKAVESCA